MMHEIRMIFLLDGRWGLQVVVCLCQQHDGKAFWNHQLSLSVQMEIVTYYLVSLQRPYTGRRGVVVVGVGVYVVVVGVVVVVVVVGVVFRPY